MHDSAYRIGELVMRIYTDLPNAQILEVGSLNVNGCLRDAALPTTRYVGMDLEEGPSVDFVLTPGEDFPVENDSFDLVMASSVFEHDSRFWDTFIRMCRAARAGGHIYVNAPSNGTVHRYPMDCWRFYPDAGLALVEYARSQGLEIDLVESFIGNRHSDVWNDFVAVFRKGPSSEPLNTSFVYHRYPSLNARTWQSRAVYNESDSTEDMALIADLRQRCETLAGHEVDLEQARAALGREQEERVSIAAELARLAVVHDEVCAHRDRTVADNEHLKRQLADAEQNQNHNREQENASREELSGKISTLESNLRQRQEEAEQAWARVQELTAEREELKVQVDMLRDGQDALSSKLAKTDGWVFTLASERRSLEGQLSMAQSELEKAKLSIARFEAISEFKDQLLDGQNSKNRLILSGLAQLRNLENDPALLHTQTKRLLDDWRDVDGTGRAHPFVDLAALLHTIAQSFARLAQENAWFSMNAAILGDQKIALHQDVAMLVERVERSKAAEDQARAEVSQLNDALTAMRSEALNYHSRAAATVEELNNVQAKSAQQLRMFRGLEDRAVRKDRDLNWLRKVYGIMDAERTGLPTLLPGHIRRQRMLDSLIRNGLFDPEAYLAKYPDVAAAGMDPLRHYILHGMVEGRHLSEQA